MKNTLLMMSLVGLFGFSQLSYAVQSDSNQMAKQQYSQLVDKGQSYKDAYQQLAYEIAYENASVQAKQPCRKMVRGL